jgi:Rieske Fe-S protein
VQALNRRAFICAGAAVAALTALPAIAATGVKTLKNGKTVIDLAANKTLTEVGGLIELSIKKYGKVAVVRTSKSANGFSVINLACPHAGVLVSKSSEGWSCNPPGHGSVFALNGALKVGPASSPLKSIKFTATSKALTIN